VIELLGILAGCLTTLCWVPQLVRTWRRGTADDISGTYLFTLGTGVAGWIVYGLLKGDIAVIFANAVTFMLLLGLVAMKYGRTARHYQHSAPEGHDALRPSARAAG
jgi:MtN3 and saliva related transmembrane protein